MVYRLIRVMKGLPKKACCGFKDTVLEEKQFSFAENAALYDNSNNNKTQVVH